MGVTQGRLSEALVASFAAMAEAEMAGLRRFAVGLCADPHRADDLVQAALERMYAAWPRLHQLERPDAYARTVLVRLALREQRLHRWRRESATGTLPEPAGEDPTDGSVDRLDLAALMATLTVKQRAVLLLRYVEDRPVAQVAAMLGVGEGTVKRRSHDALALLRQHAATTTEQPMVRRSS